MAPEGRRIVVACFGSLGDLHPFLAVASELRARGHHVVIATASFYGDRVAALGFECRPIGPPVSPEDPELLHRLMRTRRGPEYLFREVFLPHLPQLYRELEEVCQGADALLAGEVVFAAPILAEKTGLPFVSALLSPISFLSAHDPSVLPPLGFLEMIHDWPPAFHRALLQLPLLVARRWEVPLNDLRRSLGLQPRRDVLMRGKLDADRVLAMFSSHFAPAQPDWPAGTVQTGFAYFQQEWTPTRDEAERRLGAFLAAGPPPLVFTLGSAAVHAPGNFFPIAAAAAHRLQRRAVLVGDRRGLGSPDILAVPYADYSKLFPRAMAVVHQGGIGTTAEALRAGVPQIVVPFNFDQPDNAARIVRLGAGISVPRRKWNARHAHYALMRVMRDGALRERAAELGGRIRRENGAAVAADAVESLWLTEPE